jgi:hypothetical protein
MSPPEAVFFFLTLSGSLLGNLALEALALLCRDLAARVSVEDVTLGAASDAFE